MREILFRGKRIDNGQWVEGYLFDDGLAESSQFFIGSIVIEKEEGTAAYDYCITGRDFYAVSLETIGQYTGLTDKNGRKIFEGDILSVHLDDSYPDDITYVQVVWSGLSWCIRESANDDAMEKADGLLWEVCGNVFDNSQLINQTEI